MRDPTDYYYGRAPITEEARERVWRRVLDAIRSAFASLEEAERDGLRIASPALRVGAPPRPYRLPKRRPKVLASTRVGLPPLPGERH